MGAQLLRPQGRPARAFPLPLPLAQVRRASGSQVRLMVGGAGDWVAREHLLPMAPPSLPLQLYLASLLRLTQLLVSLLPSALHLLPAQLLLLQAPHARVMAEAYP